MDLGDTYSPHTHTHTHTHAHLYKDIPTLSLSLTHTHSYKDTYTHTHLSSATKHSPEELDHVVHSKGDQSWVFFGRNDAKAETPVLWPPHAKS